MRQAVGPFVFGSFVLLFSLVHIFSRPLFIAQADTVIKDEVDALNAQVKEQRTRVKKLDQLIDGYKQRILEQENKKASLENEVVLLDNRVAKKRLDIERTKAELEALRLEIAALAEQIGERGARIERQKTLAADMLRRMHAADGVMPLEIFLTEKSLSTFFNRIEEITRLERDLEDALDQVKDEKLALEAVHKEEEAKRQRMEEEQKKLRKDELALEAERNFKSSLTEETRLKQSEFERVVYELKEQQQSTADDIANLEDKLKEKLDSIDEALARGDVLLNWPVDPSRGITSVFHDPEYPFRHLFEHPGTDIRAKVGTPVKSAAGGYVAWNKKGRLYGNYTMVVHPGNIATVYAHLSRFIAKPDTYVERGQVIAESGGMPGQAGAGLSTGPHLHFEVRQGGIPVNPESFLPSVE